MDIVLDSVTLQDAALRGMRWQTEVAQTAQPGHPEDGALRNDYDMGQRQWHYYEPLWHTAQALRAWLALGMKPTDPAASAAIRYICRAIVDCPEKPFLHGATVRPDGRRRGELATTTLTDAIPGIVDAFLVSGDPELRAALERASVWLYNHARDPETGFYFSFFNGETGAVSPHDTYNLPGHPEYANKRPESEGASLLLLGQLFRHEGLRLSFRSVLDYLASDQHEDGIWWNWSCNRINPHLAHGRYNLWIAHALLDGYAVFGDERYLAAARRTAEFYRRAQQLDGVIPYNISPDGKGFAYQVCGSAIAMSCLLWLRLMQIRPDRLLAEHLLLSLRFLLSTQYGDDFFDENLRGAFFESSQLAPHTGFSVVRVRDIATTFSLQLISKCLELLKQTACDTLEEVFDGGRAIPRLPWPSDSLLSEKP